MAPTKGSCHASLDRHLAKYERLMTCIRHVRLMGTVVIRRLFDLSEWPDQVTIVLIAYGMNDAFADNRMGISDQLCIPSVIKQMSPSRRCR